MSDDIGFDWNDLPKVCKNDVELKALFYCLAQHTNPNTKSSPLTAMDAHQELVSYLRNENICDCSNQFIKDNLKLSNIDLEKLLIQLKNISAEATKKSIAKILTSCINDEKTQKTVLIYLSGMFRLNFSRTVSQNPNSSPEIIFENCYSIALSEQDDSFIAVNCTSEHWQQQSIRISLKKLTDAKACFGIVECIELIGFIEIDIDLKKSDDNINGDENINGIAPLGFIISGIKLMPNAEVKYFDMERLYYYERANHIVSDGKNSLHCITSAGAISSIDISIKQNQDCYLEGFSHSSLTLNNFKGSISCCSCSFTSINWNNCEFNSLPNIDAKSSVHHSVNIDSKTFDSLLNIKNSGSLECSRLAEFFNRNNAYLEAQRLHRHYLKTKANESKNWGLKVWIWLYDLVSECGTNLLMPFLFLLILLYINVSILATQFRQVECGSQILSSAIKNTMPFLGIVSNHSMISNTPPLILLAFNITAWLATLLWFLISLQIRRLLKLKE